MTFSSKHKGYYVFIGRIDKEKGVAEAITLAKNLHKKLIIIGSSIPGQEYWEKKIKPQIDQKQILYLGHVEQKKVFNILKYAEAFIFPIQWDEPFGLVMIEAMACGVPVIAFNRGSVSEVVKNSYSGFVVNNLKEAKAALKNLSKINRKDCRQWVENEFTLEKMMNEYEKVYFKILNN